MKILLIQACAKSIKRNKANRKAAKMGVLPPAVILRVAAITPKKHEITVIDDTYQKIDYNKNFDIVGITAITMTAPRAYEIADEFRKNGITVVLGGWHPSALPKEAKKHADSVVVAEAEETWPKLLNDFENGNLKAFYYPEKPWDIKFIEPYNHKLGFRNIFTPSQFRVTRGCPVGCEFCAITNQEFGRIHRKMPIQDAIKTLKSIPNKGLSSADPSMTINVKYSKEFFKAIKPLKKVFSCFGNVNVLSRDEELLKLSKEAGCAAWSMGFESVSQSSIDSVKKGSNKVEEYAKAVEKIHKHKMAVVGSFIFGLDGDKKDIFDATLNAAIETELDAAHFYILTPFPGTPLYDKMEKQDRIFSKDWEKYDLFHCVFEPKNMSAEELTEGAKYVAKKFHEKNLIKKRNFKSLKLGFFPFYSMYIFNKSSRDMYLDAFEYAFC